MSNLSKENNYALCVGIGNRDEDGLNLSITAKDAERIAKELITRCPFKSGNVITLLNEQSTKPNLLNNLKNIADKTVKSKADLIIIYFSGHGCELNGEYYLVCRDTSNAEIAATGINGKDFVAELDKINTDKLLILLDCCHANGITAPRALPFDEQFLLSKGNRAVISASHASQVSFLSRPLSIFTYALIEGLAGKYFEGDDQDVTIFDLALYLRERVYPLSDHKQKPQLNILKNGQTSNFVIARYPNGEPRPPAFPETFSLLDNDGKTIDTTKPLEKDPDFKQKFNWYNISINNSGQSVKYVTAGRDVTLINTQGSDRVAEKALDILQGVLEANNGKPKSAELKEHVKIDEQAILDMVFMQKQTLMLIGRKEFKLPLLRMFKGDIKDVIVLKGKEKSGLSYLKNLVSDLSENYKLFEFYDVDLYKLTFSYPNELLTPAHIAEEIATKIGMPFNTKEFKIQPFINTLRIELNKRAFENRKCFLYIHNFNIGLETDVKHLISGLASMVAVENAEVYIIIAGHKEADAWELSLKKMATPVSIEATFTKDHIEKFLERVYTTCSNGLRIKVTKDTFIETGLRSLSESIFAQSDRSNVKEISETLDVWYQEIQQA